MTRAKARRWSRLVLALTGVIALSGCGSAGDHAAAKTPVPAPQKVALRFLKALADGDGKVACKLMSPAFSTVSVKEMQKGGLLEDADGHTCQDAIKVGSEFVSGAGGLEIKSVKTTMDGPHKARVKVVFSKQPTGTYILEDRSGTWLIVDRLDEDGISDANS